MAAAVETRSSILFDWTPTIFSVDDGRGLIPGYRVAAAAAITKRSVRPRFQDLPSAGIWADRTETDEELLDKLGGNWSDFGVWD